MEPSKIKTSESLLVAGGLIFIIMLSAFIPAKWFGIKPIRTHEPLDIVSITKMSELSQDSDNNGNPDWRDLLNSTVKASTSTSELIKNTPIDLESQKRLNDPNNLTGSFSKNLYIASAYLEQMGVTDTQTQQDILNRVVAQEANKITPTTYTYQDLHILPKETKSDLKAYGNNIALILKDIITEETITEDLVSVDSFTNTSDISNLDPLIKNRNRIDSLLKKLLAMQVPSSAASYHVLALTRIALYRDLLDSLSKSNVDPVRATLAINQYTDTVVMVLRLKAQFSSYFNSENIVFSPKDAGYVFTVGYNTDN